MRGSASLAEGSAQEDFRMGEGTLYSSSSSSNMTVDSSIGGAVIFERQGFSL